MGRLSQVIEKEFGFPIREEFTPFAEALSTTAERILKGNPDRISWDVFNLGTVAVYLAHESTVSSTNGFYVGANGGHVGMVWDEDGELVGFEVWAIAASGTPSIFIKAVEGA